MHRIAFISFCIASSACGAGPAAQEEPAPSKKQPVLVVQHEAADLASGSFGEYQSDRFDLRLPLPDAPRFQISDDARSPWLIAEHRAAQSTLYVRVWHSNEMANRTLCETQARIWKDFPERKHSDIFDERRLYIPAGFDTVASMGILVLPSNPKKIERAGDITGFIMAFGGWARRCFAYVFTTKASGKQAERLIATRLATMFELSLQNIKLQKETDPELPREPIPRTP